MPAEVPRQDAARTPLAIPATSAADAERAAKQIMATKNNGVRVRFITIE
jgi:hypothetical protein